MRKLTIDEMKETQLNMLKEFDRICRENKLRYSLCGGTLLGAIRHNGYIPWDDDIDVMMPRPDFEQLMKIRHEGRFIFRSPMEQNEGRPYIYSYGKMLDTYTELIEFPNSKKIISNVYIDIFPIDGIPNEDAEHLKLYKKIHRLVLINRALEISYYNRSDRTQSVINRIFWSILWNVRNALPPKVIMKKIEELVQKRNFDEEERVGSLVAGYGPKEKFLKRDFEIMKKDFEGYEFSIIKGYDFYLRILYKDYMQLPPYEKRVAAHDCIAYEVK